MEVFGYTFFFKKGYNFHSDLLEANEKENLCSQLLNSEVITAFLVPPHFWTECIVLIPKNFIFVILNIWKIWQFWEREFGAWILQLCFSGKMALNLGAQAVSSRRFSCTHYTSPSSIYCHIAHLWVSFTKVCVKSIHIILIMYRLYNPLLYITYIIFNYT